MNSEHTIELCMVNKLNLPKNISNGSCRAHFITIQTFIIIAADFPMNTISKWMSKMNKMIQNNKDYTDGIKYERNA